MAAASKASASSIGSSVGGAGAADEAERAAGQSYSSEFIARYYVTKHSWRGKYRRILAIGPQGVVTVNPVDWDLTNSYLYGTDLSDVVPARTNSTDFMLATKRGTWRGHVRRL